MDFCLYSKPWNWRWDASIAGFFNRKRKHMLVTINYKNTRCVWNNLILGVCVCVNTYQSSHCRNSKLCSMSLIFHKVALFYFELHMIGHCIFTWLVLLKVLSSISVINFLPFISKSTHFCPVLWYCIWTL